jgi:hypothetical protein
VTPANDAQAGQPDQIMPSAYHELPGGLDNVHLANVADPHAGHFIIL